jgi:hypothetical protein
MRPVRPEPDSTKQALLPWKSQQKTFIPYVRDSTDKSFLLLFFKKEGLAFLS